jgi:hypothetical protein
MKKDVLNFCTACKGKIKDDLNNKNLDSHSLIGKYLAVNTEFRVRIIVDYAMGVKPNITDSIFLDKEDLKYLYDKYVKKLEAEKQSNIDELMSDYLRIVQPNK